MSALHKSAIAGDTRRIEQLLLQGAYPDFHDEKDGLIPLMAACLGGKAGVDAGVDAVRMLIDGGSNVNAVGKGRRSSLACRPGILRNPHSCFPMGRTWMRRDDAEKGRCSIPSFAMMQGCWSG